MEHRRTQGQTNILSWRQQPCEVGKQWGPPERSVSPHLSGHLESMGRNECTRVRHIHPAYLWIWWQNQTNSTIEAQTGQGNQMKDVGNWDLCFEKVSFKLPCQVWFSSVYFFSAQDAARRWSTPAWKHVWTNEWTRAWMLCENGVSRLPIILYMYTYIQMTHL